MNISGKQRKVYEFVLGYVSEHGQSPTIAEIGEAMHLRSPSSVWQHIERLERAGLLRKVKNVARGIELTHEGLEPLVLPHTIPAERAAILVALERIATSLETVAERLSAAV